MTVLQKRDQLKCENCSGIRLLNMIYKILSNILYDRLSNNTEENSLAILEQAGQLQTNYSSYDKSYKRPTNLILTSSN